VSEYDEGYDERRAVLATRRANAAAGYPYARADADEERRQRELELESWKAEDAMIWDDIRACGECRRGTGDFDQPRWWHCAEHLGELTEHAVYRPR
jgi:hypothetical protein